jgi:hypothetical protein
MKENGMRNTITMGAATGAAAANAERELQRRINASHEAQRAAILKALDEKDSVRKVKVKVKDAR